MAWPRRAERPRTQLAARAGDVTPYSTSPSCWGSMAFAGDGELLW